MSCDLAIVGPGALGLSLADWAAECGLSVQITGRDIPHGQRALLQLEARWDRELRRKRRSPAHIQASRSRIRASQDLRQAAIILEALPEDFNGKAQAWKAIATQAAPQALLLTATSSLSVSALIHQASLARPLLGFHLFVPVHRMRILELAVPSGTPSDAITGARELAQKLDLQVVQVADQPGFAASRMALVQGLEAMRLLEQGIATAHDIDALMVQGYGHPCGPLELSDRIGLDLRLAISEQLFQATGDIRYAPPAILRRKVAEGHTGRKSGQGFYPWDLLQDPDLSSTPPDEPNRSLHG